VGKKKVKRDGEGEGRGSRKGMGGGKKERPLDPKRKMKGDNP